MKWRRDLVIHVVPICNQDIQVILREAERDGYDDTIVDADGPVATGGHLKAERREVEEAAYLILDLHMIRPVLPRWYRAVRSWHSIVPRVPPHLHSIPTTKMSITDQ